MRTHARATRSGDDAADVQPDAHVQRRAAVVGHLDLGDLAEHRQRKVGERDRVLLVAAHHRHAEELRAAVVELMSSPNLADTSWITRQYDRYVRGNTAMAAPDDAGDPLHPPHT